MRPQPTCEMCGGKGPLSHARVEGVELDVCASCARFGKTVPRSLSEKEMKSRVQQEMDKHLQKKYEAYEKLVEGYASKLKKAREKIGLKQEELAKRLNMKESHIQKMESGDVEPSLDEARKLEKFFRITLVETYKEEGGGLVSAEKSGPLTLGDMIKIKKR